MDGETRSGNFLLEHNKNLQAQNTEYKKALNDMVERHHQEMMQQQMREAEMIEVKTRELHKALEIERERLREARESNCLLSRDLERYKYYVQEKEPLLNRIQQQLQLRQEELYDKYEKAVNENHDLKHQVTLLTDENRAVKAHGKRSINESGKLRLQNQNYR